MEWVEGYPSVPCRTKMATSYSCHVHIKDLTAWDHWTGAAKLGGGAIAAVFRVGGWGYSSRFQDW